MCLPKSKNDDDKVSENMCRSLCLATTCPKTDDVTTSQANHNRELKNTVWALRKTAVNSKNGLERERESDQSPAAGCADEADQALHQEMEYVKKSMEVQMRTQEQKQSVDVKADTTEKQFVVYDADLLSGSRPEFFITRTAIVDQLACHALGLIYTRICAEDDVIMTVGRTSVLLSHLSLLDENPRWLTL
jgi:hypothetical protein